MRAMLGALLVLVVGAALFVAWVRLNESRMIYYPERWIGQTPDAAGLRYQDVRLTASDGVRLHAWLVFAPRGTGAGLDSLPASGFTVLLLHGNAGNISNRLEKAGPLAELGADVLLLDYRGYGNSAGRPDEQGTYRDARAAYDYLTRERGLDPRSIVLYGESLGSAVATQLASDAPAAGVVLEAAFTSIPDVAQSLYRFLPVGPLVRNRYDSIRRIGRIEAPLLLLHSRDDEYLSMRHAERLLAAATSPKRLVVLRGGHNDAFLVSRDLWRGALEDFFREIATTGR